MLTTTVLCSRISTAKLSPTSRTLGSVQQNIIKSSSRSPLTTRNRRGRSALVVHANELNKWAGRSMDDQCDPNPFDKETATVLLRVLTARAVKKLLYQLQELDLFVAQWFNNYAAENPPTTGNDFILDLFNAKGTSVVDPNTQTTHNIDPQNLAHRILQIRDDMARNATISLPEFVEMENTAVMRKHLERNTFVSGSSQSGYKERRGYFRKPDSPPAQQK